jgi:branched-chain amino acid aminotransferase
MTILNVMFVLKDRYGKLMLVTPPDNGCILQGVIPKSIEALKQKIRDETNMIFEARPISIHELISAYNEERLIEAIGCSTSSHIQPITRIVYKDHNISLPSDKDSFYVSYLNKLISDIMTGPSAHEWVVKMDL